MTVMGSLTNIAKQRPVFYQRVVQAFEALHGEFVTLVYINIAGDKNSTRQLAITSEIKKGQVIFPFWKNYWSFLVSP